MCGAGADGQLQGHLRPSELWEECDFSTQDLFPREKVSWAGTSQTPALATAHISHVAHLGDITERLTLSMEPFARGRVFDSLC